MDVQYIEWCIQYVKQPCMFLYYWSFICMVVFNNIVGETRAQLHESSQVKKTLTVVNI